MVSSVPHPSELFPDLPRSKDQAKAEGAPYYFPEMLCHRRHMAPRATRGSGCLACKEEDARKAREVEQKAILKARQALAQEKERQAKRKADKAPPEAASAPLADKQPGQPRPPEPLKTRTEDRALALFWTASERPITGAPWD